MDLITYALCSSNIKTSVRELQTQINIENSGMIYAIHPTFEDNELANILDILDIEYDMTLPEDEISTIKQNISNSNLISLYINNEILLKYINTIDNKALFGTVNMSSLDGSSIITFCLVDLDGGRNIFINKSAAALDSASSESGVELINLVDNLYVTYTVKIDNTMSNPNTCCTYMDDAVGMTKGSDEWDNMPIFADIKPCVFNEGQVVYYLDRNDYTKKADGTASVLDGTDGDVMVEFPNFKYRIYKDGTDIYVSITNDPKVSDERYSNWTELTGEHWYEGAYKGYIDANTGKLRSISGVTPTVSKNLTEFRAAATANGAGYYQQLFYHITALQCLYLIKYGNLNSQAALGGGYTDGSSGGYTAQMTGATDSLGFCYGTKNNNLNRMKLFGIEDFWGNIFDWVEGLRTDENNSLIISEIVDSSGAEVNTTTVENSNTSGYYQYIRYIFGTTVTGFIPFYDESDSGSTSTYFAGDGGVGPSGSARFGGGCDANDGAGVFCLGVDWDPSYRDSALGGRLAFH